MSAKEKIKKIAILCGWVLMVASLFVLAGFVEVKQKEIICREIRVNIDYQGGDIFLSTDEIKAMVMGEFGGQVVGKTMKSLSLERIHDRLAENPYIRKTQIYSTVDGNLIVNVLQYKPILRVFNSRGQSYYVATEGTMLPLSEMYTARVPVATGLIPDPYSVKTNLIPGKLVWDEADRNLTTLQKLYLMARYLESNDFFRAQVDQIFVNAHREMELIPKVGNHVILFGGVNDLEEKFDKLMAFYQDGLRTKGWSKYTILNIKYKNQVICSNK